jgi:uncharacterized DUF497 family protein
MHFKFDWDDSKAASNLRKHGISFELASTVFRDPRLLTVADLAHSEMGERWFSVISASNGGILSIIYLWSEIARVEVMIRLISAEMRQYRENAL